MQVPTPNGFTIEDLLEPLGVTLNIPPFVGQQSQHSPADVIATQEIASERIHLARAINKIKNFQIFNQVIPLFSWFSQSNVDCMCNAHKLTESHLNFEVLPRCI